MSDAIAEAAPRTDAVRVSELMHAIYQKAIAEEAEERERFLKEVLPEFRASTTPAPVPQAPPPRPSRPPPAPQRATKSSTPKPAARPPALPPQNRKSTKREAAFRVLAELAAEDGSGPSQK